MCTGAALIVIACSALSGSAKTAVITLGIIVIVAAVIRLARDIYDKANKED